MKIGLIDVDSHNFPEWRTVKIDTMEQFHASVAV